MLIFFPSGKTRGSWILQEPAKVEFHKRSKDIFDLQSIEGQSGQTSAVNIIYINHMKN